MKTNNKLGIYIHIPFCVHKCPYCDFFSVDNANDKLIKDFQTAMITEIEYSARSLKETNPNLIVDTIYFGGGTPTILPKEVFERIFNAVAKFFPQSNDVEITIEANPRTVDFDKLKFYRSLGVNRISIGVQSFDNEVLATLGRVHNAKDAEDAFNLARKAGFDNISIDLMFGIYGQTLDIWENTVKKALSLKPEHISLYSLEFMEGTKFFEMRESGEFKETDELIDRRMYESALKMMEQNGYMQYEISNVALDEEHRSRHNLKYWNLDEYLGLGPSAHSFIDGNRSFNFENLALYIDSIKNNKNTKAEVKKNTLADNISEYVFTGLRKNIGINLIDFQNRFGIGLWDYYDENTYKEFQGFVQGGFARETTTSINLTQKGFNISNKIMCLFV